VRKVFTTGLIGRRTAPLAHVALGRRRLGGMGRRHPTPARAVAADRAAGRGGVNTEEELMRMIGQARASDGGRRFREIEETRIGRRRR